jgi:succinate dehydrogenase / fumarate reductase cytochrome b subunit
MSRILTLYRSSLGKKATMAVSGVVLFGFVFIHMVGNLKLYLGPEKLNHYGEFLREVGSPVLGHAGLLWIARLVLLAAVVLHMWSAWAVTRQSWSARPRKYTRRERVQIGYAERTMRWGGVIIAFFVFYHLAQFTWGFGWALSDFRPGEPYHNVVTGFSIWWVSAFYIVAQVFLGMHLYHGVWSLFQSLGWAPAGADRDWRQTFAAVFAWVIAVANISFPVAVLTGVVT